MGFAVLDIAIIGSLLFLAVAIVYGIRRLYLRTKESEDMCKRFQEELAKERQLREADLDTLKRSRGEAEELERENGLLRARIGNDEENLRKLQAEQEAMKNVSTSERLRSLAECEQLTERIGELQKELELKKSFSEEEQRALTEWHARLEARGLNLQSEQEKLDLEVQSIEEEKSRFEIQVKRLEKDQQVLEQREKQSKLREEKLAKQLESTENDKTRRGAPPIYPIDRWGRPRGPGPQTDDDLPPTIANRRFGIVCGKLDWEWYVGLELPQELRALDNLQIRQGGEPIARHILPNDLWILPNARNPVLVQWVENGVEDCKELTIGNSSFVFKLEGDQQKGRLVKTLSSGSYAVFAPETWQRDESESGPATVHPENAAWPGLRVHFFDFESGETPALGFLSPDGSHQAVSEVLQVDLLGNQISDASESIGPLFGGSPPVLRARSIGPSSKINTGVIGEEGPEGGGWRKLFAWDPTSEQQKLPTEIETKGANWYFVRFYDKDNTFMGSLDFRFIPGLKSIQVEHRTTPDDKSVAVIVFSHEPNCVISPGDPLSSLAELEKVEGQTIARVPLDSFPNENSWVAKQEHGATVKIRVDVSTLRWSLGDESQPPDEWQQQPIVLSREMFTPTSTSCLWVQFPRTGMPTRAWAGFIGEKARLCRVNARGRNLRICLRDYSDAEEIRLENPTMLQFWWSSAEGFTGHGDRKAVLGSIPRRVTTYHCIIEGCSFTTQGLREFHQHADQQHDKDGFLVLVDDYDEFLAHYKNVVGNDWPNRIYLCGHCDKYVRADDGSLNPSDVIYRHLLEAHPGEGHAFRIVTSVAQIRENVIDSLPRLYRCKYGDLYIEDLNLHDTWNHLLRAHRNDFVRVETCEDFSRISE